MESAAPTSAAEWESRMIAESPEDLPDDPETTDPDDDEPEPIDDAPSGETDPAPSDEKAPQPEGADAADQANVGSADTPAPEKPQSTAEIQKIETRPFRPRVDGQEMDVPGALVTNDGRIVMTLESFNRVIQPNLTNRRALHQRHQEELAKARQEGDAESNPVVVRSRLLAQKFDELKEAGLLQVDEDALARAELEIENEILRLGVKEPSPAVETGPSEEDVEQTRQVFETGLKQSLDAILAHASYKDLGLSKEKLYKLLRPLWPNWARVADETDPHGFEPGKRYVETQFIVDFIEDIASPIRNERKRVSDVEAAKKRNADVLGGGKEAPVAVTTAGSAAVGGKKKDPPKTREEWENMIRDEDD